MKIENKEINDCKSNLKKMRITRGLTQAELSSLSGINIKSIALYEQNPSRLSKASVDTVYSIADSLNCDISSIINKETLNSK